MGVCVCEEVHLECERSEVQPERKDDGESSCVAHPFKFHPSSCTPLPPPSNPPPHHPSLRRHRCPLSATGPSEFPRARGSPLSVSSDTVIRSVGTESSPLSEARAPSFRWPWPSTTHHHHHRPANPYPPLPLPPLFLFLVFACATPHLFKSQEVASNLRKWPPKHIR